MLLGLTTNMPAMPEPTCSRAGALTQWYMNTPGWSALKRIVCVAPGAIVGKSVVGSPTAAWKSSECGSWTCIAWLKPLWNWTSTVSPWLTTIGGEAPVPERNLPLTPKDHTSKDLPSGATRVRRLLTSTRKVFTAPAGAAGSVGSGRLLISALPPPGGGGPGGGGGGGRCKLRPWPRGGGGWLGWGGPAAAGGGGWGRGPVVAAGGPPPATLGRGRAPPASAARIARPATHGEREPA